MFRRIFCSTLLLFTLVSQLALPGGPALAVAGDTTIVSHAYNPDAVQANSGSSSPSLSADGRFVAFMSLASNLVSGDTNGVADIFVYDRETDVTERVSVDSSGEEGNYQSSSPSLSADGRFVAFESHANNLVNDDANTTWGLDIFVYDRQTDLIERVSVDPSGGQANGWSYSPSLSADGRFVAFKSEASNLVSDDTNGKDDIFVYDRQTDETERVSVNSSGEEANGSSSVSSPPSLSADGRFVAFESLASNLVSGDTNGVADVFVYDRQTDLIERVSIDSSGVQADGSSSSPSLSADGCFVAFDSYASNLVNGDAFLGDIFVYDRQTHLIERVSGDPSGGQANGWSESPSFSADGRFVAFASNARNLTSGDTNGKYHIFVYDRETGGTERVSIDSSGVQANNNSSSPSLSADGQFVVFASEASNLVSGDTNVQPDIFLHEISVDNSAPVVSSIVRAGTTPSDSVSVDFTVTFSEAVTGVEVGDFRLTTAGVYGAAVSSVSGSGAIYTVTVNTGLGNGALRLDVSAGATIEDLAGNTLGSLPFTNGESYTILKAATFSDVETGYWSWQYVERLVNAGITAGCGGGQYCPEATVTRAQMAVFLERGIHGSSYAPPAVGGSTGFGDVATDHWAGAWIKQLAAEGITSGCGGGNYCPDGPVTRAQMAVFLLKAKHGSAYTPPGLGGSTGFTDVDPTHWAGAWIKQLVVEGITAGCGSGAYCPESPVTRAQMAVFLVRTFDLP